jgi:septum formation protein
LFLKSPHSLALASTSRYRQELLARLRLPFTTHAPGVDETREPGERPLALATRLALAKATTVAARLPDAWVIGSDQVAVRLDLASGEAVLGKPGTQQRCIEQLEACSSQTISYITAVALVKHGQAPIELVDTTKVRFRPLDTAVIQRYVELEMPLDCAGGFKSEGLGIALCESIDSSDPSALIGLPLIRLSAALRQVGFELP